MPGQTNWGLFFIWQKKKKGDAKRKSTNVRRQIYKLEDLKIDVNRVLRKIADGERNIKDTLRNSSPVYYHNCTSKYKKHEIDS